MYNLNTIWNIFKDLHISKVGEDLHNFLFPENPLQSINENIIYISLDEFTLKFLTPESNNYIIIKDIFSKILYLDVNIEFNSINNYNYFKSSESNNYQQNTKNKVESILNYINADTVDDTNENLNKNTNIQTNINDMESIFISNKNNSQVYENTNLKPNLNFKNFFYSYENKQLVNASKILIDSIQNPEFNPFFIYGGSGLGKTHILNAIGNEIFNRFPNKKCLYIHSTNFLEEYTSLFNGGITNPNKIDDFKLKYENIDVLLIDDIQLLEHKENSLNEFFSIFERLKNNNKLIILASDKHPEKLHFEERLITRFLSGFYCEIKIPDTDTKKQIFSYYALEKDFNVEDEAINLFIDNSNNVRSLLGYLNAITISFISNDYLGNKITKEAALNILESTGGIPKNITEESIIAVITSYYKIKKSDLLSKNRQKDIVNARHFIAYFLREKLNYNYDKIAYILNFKDHTAAINAYKSAKKKISNEKYKNDYIKLATKIN